MARPIKSSSRGKRPSKKTTFPKISIKWKLTLAGLALLLLSPFYYGYIIKNLTAAWRWARDAGHKPKYPVYKSFHIRIPVKYSIHGIDVSSYQGRIDWQKVKSMREDSVRINFAFIKATEGLLIVDPYFKRNWAECRKAGITCGAYHFFRPKYSGKWQARFFLQTIKIQKGDLPPVVDIEELNNVSPAKMRLELADFLKAVTGKTKTKPIIYSGLKFYEDNLAGYFDNYSLWLSNFDHPELAVRPGTNWQFWQHSSRAKVNGILHGVDFDLFKGDSIAFRGLAGK